MTDSSKRLSFSELATKAHEQGKASQVNYDIKSEWVEGEVIVGRLMKISKVHFEKNKSDANGYMFQTDDGLIQACLGAGVDMQCEAMFEEGQIYEITYIGMKQLAKDREMKVFRIIHIEL